MIKKLLTISLSLVLTLIPLTSPAMAGESVETATIHHIDISSMYDVDTIGGVGDTITWKATTATKFAENTGCSNCWWGYNWGDRYKDTIFQGLSALKPGFPSTLSFLNKETGDITLKKVKWGTDGAASLSENPETFTFKTFNSDSFKGGTMDGKKLYNKGTFTASLKPLYTRSIKFLMGSVISGNNAALKGTITYVDGTTTTFKEQWYVSANNGNDIRVDEMTYYDKTYYTTKNSGRSENIRAFALNNEKFAPVVQSVNEDGTTYSLIADTTTDENDASVPYEVENIGFRGYEVDVDPTKAVKEITIATAWGSYDTYSCILYALAQEEANSSDYYAYLDNFDVDANQPDANGVFTAEQATAIRSVAVAMNELQGKDLSGYTAISDLISQYNSAELIYDTDADDATQYYIDLRKVYNYDAIASIGDIVAANKVDTFAMLSKTLPANTDNYVNFNRVTDPGTSAATIVQVADVKMFMDGLTYLAGVNDSIKLAEVGNSVTIPLVETNTKNIRFTVDNKDAVNYDVTVNYSDNTSDSYTISFNAINTLWTTNSQLIGAVETEEAKRNGLIGMNPDYTYHPSYTLQDDGTYLVGYTKNTSYRRGPSTYQVVPDATKVPVSVTFKANAENMIIYTLSQKALTTDDINELKTYVDTLNADENFYGTFTKTTDEDGNITYENSVETAATAYKYYTFLLEKDVIAAEDYSKIGAIGKQLDVQEEAYVDLSDNVDADLIVPAGEEVPEDFVWEETSLFNADYAPEDGVLTAAASGNTYKLSGNYKDVGADAVKVSDESFKVELKTGRLKGINVIIEKPDAGDNGQSINVTVKYTDETVDELTAMAYKADNPKINANYPESRVQGFGRINAQVKDDADDSKATGEVNGLFNNWTESGFNGKNMVESTIAIDTTKTVESITFNTASSSYYIFAITLDAYTNLELVELTETLPVTTVAEVTKENAQATADAGRAYIELYNRGFTSYVDAANISLYKALVEQADKFLIDGEIVFTPAEVVVADGTASSTVTMKNTTGFPQDYVLVIAAYSDENCSKLLDISIGDAKSLKAETDSATDTINMPAVTDAKLYKVFVWETVKSLKPIQ